MIERDFPFSVRDDRKKKRYFYRSLYFASKSFLRESKLLLTKELTHLKIRRKIIVEGNRAIFFTRASNKPRERVVSFVHLVFTRSPNIPLIRFIKFICTCSWNGVGEKLFQSCHVTGPKEAEQTTVVSTPPTKKSATISYKYTLGSIHQKKKKIGRWKLILFAIL